MAKCSECGFLAIRNSMQSTLIEAPGEYRDNGFLRNDARSLSLNTCSPACFIRKVDLEGEFYTSESLSQISEFKNRIKSILQSPRSCNASTPWLQGFTPKEHKEMLDKAYERRWRLIEGLIFAVTGGAIALLAEWISKADPPIINITPPTINGTVAPTNAPSAHEANQEKDH